MKILIILGHSKPNSLNHAIADTAMNVLKTLGHEVVFYDLYQENFDPVLPAGEENLPEEQLPERVRQHLHDFKMCDGVIFIHPNWWGGPPAILRGWVDRVVRTGSCYQFTPDGVVSHVDGKIVQVFSTSNTPREIELNVYGDPIEVFWKTIVFGILGCQSFERRNFESVVLSTTGERADWLAETASIIERRFGLGLCG